MMDVKNYLKQIHLLNVRIDSQMSERKNLMEMITKITSTFKDDYGASSGYSDKLGNSIAKIVDLENEINENIDNLVDMKADILCTLEKFNDPDQYQVLYKRYFKNETLEKIACDLNMTYRNVCYIHGKALNTFADILEKKERSEDYDK